MRKVLLLCALVVICGDAMSQEKKIPPYRRSSLYTIMLDDQVYMDSRVIKKAFEKAPLPEKFNDHNLKIRCIDARFYQVTNDERMKAHEMKGESAAGNKLRSIGRSAANTATMGVVQADDMSDLPLIFNKFFIEKNVARDLVAKWYNIHPDGSFDMELIAERGLYDATEMQAGIASKSARGISLLKDAGQELIANTFVVGIRFKYVDKEEIAISANTRAQSVGNLLGGVGGLATSAVSQVGTRIAARGYVVQANACLFRLVWNEEIQAIFENNYWSNPDSFARSSDFKLELVGEETAWADVQSSTLSKKTDDELVERATVRSVDAVISKLQRKYEEFRTKTPLVSTEPVITAQIGLKEGLEAGDKFEILEQLLDPESGTTTYQRKGVISVMKAQIWDNRYNAGEETSEAGVSNVPDITSFKGSAKGIYPGMLIRQIK